MAIEKNVNVIISATDRYSTLMTGFAKNWTTIGMVVLAAEAALVAFSIAMAKITFDIGKDFVSSAADFHDAIFNVEAVSQSFGTTGKEISNLLTDLTIRFPLTGAAAGDALELIAQMGYGTEQQMRRMSEAAVTLQIATGTDLQIAAQGTMATMNAFGLEIVETERVMNLFAAAHFTSAASVSKLTESMKFAAPAARLVGMSIEDTVAFLAQLVSKGLEASQAGTTFRMAMAKVFKETDAGTAALASMGLTYTQLQGAVSDASKFIGLFEGKTIRAKEAVAIFGVRASTISLILNDGAEKFNKYRDSITGTTAAVDAMEKKLQTWGVVTKMVEGDMDVLKKTIGMDLLKAIIDVIGLDEKSGIRGLITAIRELEEVQHGIGGPMVAIFEQIRDSAKDMFTDAFGDAEGFYDWLSTIFTFLSVNFGIVAEWTLMWAGMFAKGTKDREGVIAFLQIINGSFGALSLTVAMVHDVFVGFFTSVKLGFGVIEFAWNSVKFSLLTGINNIYKMLDLLPDRFGFDYSKEIAETNKELDLTKEKMANAFVLEPGRLWTDDVLKNMVKSSSAIYQMGQTSKKSIEETAVSVTKLRDNWESVDASLVKIDGGIAKIDEGSGKLVDNWKYVGDSVKAVTDEASGLEYQVTVLEDGTRKFTSGLKDAADGAKVVGTEIAKVGAKLTDIQKHTLGLETEQFKSDLRLVELETKQAGELIKTTLAWTAKLDIAQVQASAIKVKAIFESIGASVVAAAEATATMFSSLADIDSTMGSIDKGILQDTMKEQMSVQRDLADTQIRLTNAQSTLLELQADSIRKDGMKIEVTIAGDTTGWLTGLMNSLLNEIFIKAESEGFQCFGV